MLAGETLPIISKSHHLLSAERIFEFVVGLLYKIEAVDHPRCVVIIDCFEVFIDRPTNLLARAQTYSQYKHHNTVKYLIGITLER